MYPEAEEGGGSMKKRIRRIFQVCLLIAVITVPAHLVFAYFTDYEAARGGAIVGLTGQTEIYEEVTDTEKVVRIRNVGETNVVVRVAIEGSYMNSVTPSEGWIQDGNFWYYDSILTPQGGTVPAGEEAYYSVYETSPITVSIDSSEAAADGQDFDIVVTANAQAAAWEFDEASQTNELQAEDWPVPDISIPLAGEAGE